MNDLCIGGGGYSGVIFIGCLEYLDKHELLDLKNFYGTSIGSLIGVAYILGIKPKTMIQYLLNLDFKELVKYDLGNLKDNYIICDNFLDNLIKLLDTRQKFSNLTLKEIKDKTGVNINIHVTDVEENAYICMNNLTHPHLEIGTVIKASMSIPFLFKPVEIEGKFYIDGCCKNLSGIPDKEIYILGYTIILESGQKAYLNKVMDTILTRPKPRSTFVIKCKTLENFQTYLKLNELNNSFIFDMFKNGIEICREQLE
jgi:predicted patatin/cPLA2 family phospholipase